MSEKNPRHIALRTQVIAIGTNLFLSAFKLSAGLISHSRALVSDAINSMSDVFSSLIVLVGVNMSLKDSDKEHPYGHERMESIAAMIVSAILFITGFGIGYDGIKKILVGMSGEFPVPGVFALVAAVCSVIIKEALFWYTRAGAKKLNSNALAADAWNHRSDALSSLGGLVGIFGARIGFPILDPIAGVLICIPIIRAAFQIFRDAVRKLVDQSCAAEILDDMERLILSLPGVCGLDSLHTRQFGSKIYADIEISADGSISLHEAHDIAERVHDEIENRFPNVKHCTVHVNPKSEKDGNPH